MQNKKLSIRKIVSYLNDDEADGGGFWLPNIQRPFVWNEDQIARLFDSIMREYPISTLLVWKTKEAFPQGQGLGCLAVGAVQGRRLPEQQAAR
ncbi:MAG: DUF262 domain-containing protein [Ideonella sp.]|nr:DUF262 domain-containing protein [Ideonella sp.]